MMIKLPQVLVMVLIASIFSGCQSTGSNPAKSIVGTWTSEIGGFPLTVEYVAGQVRIEGYADVPYLIEDTTLTVAGVTRSVTFPSPDEMIQTDPLTNTDQKFTRIK